MSARRIDFCSIAQCSDVRGVAVVIDVLRAFTTAAWAFERGAERILLTSTLSEALELKDRIAGALALKDGEPEPGFDLTNSPVAMRTHEDVQGHTIVQCTTAGTPGAVAARTAERLYCASFVCAAATAAAVRAAGDLPLTFVVTGDDGLADEDDACARYIAALIERPASEPGAYIERARGSRAAARLRERLAQGQRGVQAGDIELCLEANRFSFVMRAEPVDGLLTLRRETP